MFWRVRSCCYATGLIRSQRNTGACPAPQLWKNIFGIHRKMVLVSQSAGAFGTIEHTCVPPSPQLNPDPCFPLDL